MIVFLLALIAVMYWYFGTEQGHAIRATGCNEQYGKSTGHQYQLSSKCWH